MSEPVINQLETELIKLVNVTKYLSVTFEKSGVWNTLSKIAAIQGRAVLFLFNILIAQALDIDRKVLVHIFDALEESRILFGFEI